VRASTALSLVIVLAACTAGLAACAAHHQPAPPGSGVYGILVINRSGKHLASTPPPSPLPGGFGDSLFVPYPYGSTVVVKATSAAAEGSVVARVSVPKGGAIFRVSLSPGSYALSAGRYHVAWKAVVVRSGSYTRVVLQAGMRI
jgi:hypothetical protein